MTTDTASKPHATAASDAVKPAPDLLQVKGLTKYFPIKGGIFSTEVGRVHAVDGVTLSLAAHRGGPCARGGRRHAQHRRR